MAQSFASVIERWAEKTEREQTEVAHVALRLLDAEIAANVPVKSGNTRNSRTVSNAGRPAVDFKTKKFRDPSDAIKNAIAGVEIGRSAWLGFRAPWAHKIEEKYAFMRLAVQRWPAIVAEAARIVRRG